MITKLEAAFVLAAGRGERLRPYTDKTPKPLMEVKGVPLLDHVLQNLEPLNLKRVVLNAWHLKEQVVQYAKDRKKKFSFEILVSEENELLGTGGGLKKALPLLGAGPLLMVNGDCLWKGQVERFVDASFSAKTEGAWWLTPFHGDHTAVGVNSGIIEQIGSLWTSGKASSEKGVFTGISVFNQIYSEELPVSGCIIRDYWIKRFQTGVKLGGEFRFLESWQDIGTPDRYESVR